MRNFIRFIIKYHFTILFFIIEAVSLLLVINYNAYQRSSFLSSSSSVSGGILKRYSAGSEYLMLRDINEDLARENAYLRSRLPESFRASRDYFNLVNDSTSMQEYIYRSARVINNSTHRRFNYLTLNKGRLNGIEPEMGVISNKGAVGIVKNVSDNYSTVISIINTRLKISAKLKESGFFGSLEWDGTSYQHVYLLDIPRHANVSVGDLVVTSGYSSIFPEGILLGNVEDVELDKGASFYRIRVKLSVDFKNLSFVEVIGHNSIAEQINLEKISEDD
ncbi:rod shape-determining protein MreC [Carboxylicivirga sp. M1479]|uniref:rod shape-determining protein MreC n=1 Tax=Carboxylicivirga sp. M1479 TaxID=2594476 RepID=UPI001177E503|nr:rod shape-determining protein MreC [Carboxylicivirga sp. M1479]TRX63991.1 rod shape-determining protein MreC [Carboxylicivirga sp. M1479]